jgi:hypothetical protein
MNKKSRKSSRKSMYGGSDPFNININDKDITLNPSQYNLTPTRDGSYMPNVELLSDLDSATASSRIVEYNENLLKENVTLLKDKEINHDKITQYLRDMDQTSNYFNGLYKEYLNKTPKLDKAMAQSWIEQHQQILLLNEGPYKIVQQYFKRGQVNGNFPTKFCEYYFMLKLWHRMKSDYEKELEKNTPTSRDNGALKQIRLYGQEYAGEEYAGEEYAGKEYRGGKWSMKYKKSINCKRPKGFSQKQHCKYGRKTRKNKVKKAT